MTSWKLFIAAAILATACISSVYSACTQNDIRLQAGPTKRQGRVEICRNNQWGTVCHDLWGTADARVVCNQLNYDAAGAIARKGGYFAKGWGKPIWLDNVRCGSGEYKLINCPKNCIGCHNCNHHKDAGAECPPCIDGNIWLPGGSTWREGTVELCNGGVWGTVCDDQFGTKEAKVVCTQLGYDPSTAQSFKNAYFGARYGAIILDNLKCVGTETSLFDCPGNDIGDHNCDHSEDAGVRCPACTKGSIRLWSANPDTPPSEGMVHYCHNSGEWKAMCRYEWGCTDAKVACRDLGFNGSLTAQALYDVDGVYGFYLPVLPQRVRCVGPEAVLKDCGFKYTTWCNHALYETAGVKCKEDIVGHNCTGNDLRLVNGKTKDEGRLEFCFHDEWSPFCHMHDEEASVACKQLGYTEYTIASLYNDERFGAAGYVSDFRTIACSETASEDHMKDCDIQYSWGCTINSCSVEYGIKCFNPGMCNDGEVRLVDGNIEQEGRTEICYKGVWSTICDWGWNAIDAYVMCRSLGYTGAKSPDLLLDSYFGDGVYPVAISNIACGGWEKSILDCGRKEYLDFYTCGRHTLSGMRCYEDCEDGEIRLVGGPYENEGTVEICMNGLWGLISDAGFDKNDAKVLCRQAGFPNDDEAIPRLGNYYSRPNKTVHLANIHCLGTEDKLTDCTMQTVPLSDGRLAYLNATVVGIDCIFEPPTHPPCIDINITALPTDNCAENAVRLVGGDGDNDEGRADVCVNGRWSPFCIMDEITASIICRGMGFTDYSWAKLSINTSYGVDQNFSHFDNISCPSTATSMSQCTVNYGGCIPYCPNKNIALRCYTPPICDTEGAVRLIDGFVDNEGRVEVCLNGVWGAVCDDGWDQTDSHVVCGQLGHPELVPIAYHNSFFGDGLFPIVYSKMGCGGYEKTLGECDMNVYSEFSCSRDHVAGVLCGSDCQNGDIRLAGGPSMSEGTVEVCINNVWGNILETSFGDYDASVICRLLGFFSDGAEARLGSMYGKTGATAHMSDLICYGDEASILECSYTTWSLLEGKTQLGDDANQVAGVYCITEDTCIPPPGAGNECTPGAIQLDSTDSSSMGTVQYCANGTWSPFCSLDGAAASVICKSFGFLDYNWAAIIDDDRFNPTANVSLFQNFTCTGEESSLSQCTGNLDCQSKCKTGLGVQCFTSNAACQQESVRLFNGDIAQEGRVEVCIDNVWGAICGEDWNKIDALVVCRELGLGLGEPMIYTDSTQFGETPGPTVYSKVACQGWESNLAECMKNSYYDVMCSRNSMAGVVCRDLCDDGDIKLMGGPGENEGTVVICKDGFWGLIGQTTWDDRDAKVTCRQLGYSDDGAYAQLNSYYGKPNITLQTSSVVCLGDEATLTDCQIAWVPYMEGKVAIKHLDVGGVYCPPATPPPECETEPPTTAVPECSGDQVRFMSSDPAATEGLVQYCYNGRWTYFCSMDAAVASVACRSMGFIEYSWATLVPDGFYGSGVQYSYLDSVSCTGLESSLSDCTINVQDKCLPKCDHNFAIKCYTHVGCDEGAIRLADGGFSQRGRVEQCINGVWGTFCDSGWDNTDVVTLCRSMGYPGNSSKAYSGSYFGSGMGPAIYSDVACVGHENSLQDCNKNVYPDFFCTSNQIAGALCTSVCKDGDVRLVGGSNSQEGTVEICFNNIWGMVSDLNWGDLDALVVCRQLYLGTDDVAALVGSYFGRPNDTVHLTNVGCFGDELSLQACGAAPKLDIGDAELYQTVAGVTCRAKSFSISAGRTVTSMSASTRAMSPTPEAVDGTRNSVMTTVVILGVVLLMAIIAAAIIIIGMLFMVKRRNNDTKKMTGRSGGELTRPTSMAAPPMSQVEKDVVNPLAVEADLDGDDDENTKTLQDLIQESQMK